MKRLVLFFTVLAVVVLSACGNDGGIQQDPGLPAMVEVDINLPEGSVDPGTEVVLEAYVSQAGEAVEDANEVEFEIRKHGEEKSESLEGVHQGAGIYTAPKVFAEDGTYAITAHVTARDMHNMPTEDLVVGTPSEEAENQSEEQGTDAETEAEEMEMDHDAGH